MTNPDDPAYPDHYSLAEDYVYHGLTKREYFATMAIQGMIAGSQGLQITLQQFAIQATKLADALIAELNKEQI